MLSLFLATVLPSLAFQPHVVFVMLDDWGYNDVGFRSTDGLMTPTIDKLASEGITLMTYYTQPICTPSRTALMTGRYPIRSGMNHGVIGVPAEPWGLPTNESTWAEGMKSLGYRTHIVGKWHLGLYQNASLPTSRGFDTQFGYLSGMEDYYTHTPNAPPGPDDGGGDGDGGGGLRDGADFVDLQASTQIVSNQNGSYSTYLYTAVAEGVVRAHPASAGDDAPLFLYFPLQNVHSPLEAPDEWVARCPAHQFPNVDRRTYCAMTLLADSAIKNVTDALAANNQMLDDTVFIIAGDNGGLPMAAGSAWPLKGHKAELWEGGIRNTAVIYAPRYIPRGHAMYGGSYHGLIHISDWRPSIQALAGKRDAGVQPGFEFDGVDVWTAVLGNTTSPRTEFLVNIDEAVAVPPRLQPTSSSSQPGMGHQGAALRMGAWKLVVGVPDDTWYPVPNSTDATPPSKCGPGGGDCRWEAPPGVVESYFGVTLPAHFHQPGPAKPTINGLFNIELDPEERHNFYNATEAPYPDILSKMISRLDYFRAQQIPNQNRVQDQKGNDAALECNAWVPWLPTFEGCPSTWCADIADDCGPNTECTGQALFLCSKTCKAC